MLSRTTSGVPGVDELLGGGLPSRRCVVLQGGPGSGKTTFAVQFLYEGAKNRKEPGVYVTLSESPEEIRENSKESHGWDLEKLEKGGLLSIVDARPVVAGKNGLITPNDLLFKGELLPFSHVLQLLVRSVNEIKAKRLVVDSLTVLTMQYSNRFYVRQGVLGLVQALSRLNSTSLLLVEALGDDTVVPIEVAVAPGAIALRYENIGDVMARSIQIIKMRGVKHGLQFYHMEIEDAGIKVFPEETAMTKDQ